MKSRTDDLQLTGDRAAARAIAQRRAGFNLAIQTRDWAAAEAVLAEDVVLVPGDDAESLLGRAAQMEAWRAITAQAADAVYVRNPRRIDVSEDGALAAETGAWTGGWSLPGIEVRYAGRYFAKWRLGADGWVIASEVFVTLRRS